MTDIETLIPEGSALCAPLAGYTNHFFRPAVHSLGAVATWSEMVSAEGLIRDHRRTLGYLKNVEKEAFTFVQIFGARPDSLAEAARIVQERGAAGLDINMGCPVKKVVRNGAGSALLLKPHLIRDIISSVRRVVTLPLSVKIRAGWDMGNRNYLETAKIIESEGADLLIIHPRTRSQTYADPADWSIISDLVNNVGIPVIGNGDIFSVQDGIRMLETTKCHAIMIGRYAIRNPWIFKQWADKSHVGDEHSAPEPERVWRFIEAQFDSILEELPTKSGIRYFRKFLVHYIYGLPNATTMRARIFQIEEAGELRSVLREYLLSLQT